MYAGLVAARQISCLACLWSGMVPLWKCTYGYGGSRTRIRDFVSASQRKWIEDRIGEKLKD